MKYIESQRVEGETAEGVTYIDSEVVAGKQLPVVELSRRNLEVLLTKLDDPRSLRTLVDRDDKIAVRAVENVDHYADRDPGVMFLPSSSRIL